MSMDWKWAGVTVGAVALGIGGLMVQSQASPIIPPCAWEDGSGGVLPCRWDAGYMGNATGRDVVWYPIGHAAVEANRDSGGCEWTQPDRVGVFDCQDYALRPVGVAR